MKKAFLYSAMAIATLTMNTACGDSFLEIDPVASVPEAKLANPEGVDMILTGAYSTFNNMTSSAGGMGGSSLTNWVMGDILGADANKGSQPGDQQDLELLEGYSISASNSYIANKWRAVYESVKRAHNVMSMATKIQDQLPNYTDIIAQAKFIKGFWLFEGIKNFGAHIPYVTLEDYEANTDPQVTNHDDSGTLIYIWDKVANDLKDAAAALPETRGAGEYGRATSWMAKAALAKLYLFWSSPYDGTNSTGDHWNDAKTLLDDIIANGKDAKGTKYTLADTYAELWNAETSDWTGESILDIQTTIEGTQSETNTPYHGSATAPPSALGIGGWGFYQPSYECVNNYLVDADGLPLKGYQNEERLTSIKSVPNKDGDLVDIPSTDLTKYVDPRLDITVGRFGVPYYDYGIPTELNGWVRDFSCGGLYLPKKMLPKKSDRGKSSLTTTATSTTKNAHLIRFAEVLLMRAEVAIHDGDLKMAFDLINQIRTRAAKSYIEAEEATVGSYSFDDKVDGKVIAGTAGNYRIGLYKTVFANAAEATEALQRERRIELSMEGHRWFDLTRWGIAEKTINDFRAFENKFLPKYNNVYSGSWISLPFPLSEVQTSEGRFIQSDAWK